MCLFPKIIRNRKYSANKKNGGVIPPVFDVRTLWVPVGCQKCMECRKQKARNWQVRLLEDVRHHKNGKFVTFTFSNESIKDLVEEIRIRRSKADSEMTTEEIIKEGYELDNRVATLAMRRFLERWRKKYKKSLRHWMITELGHNGTENVHMHGIVWTDESLEEVEKQWKYGFIWKGKDEGRENYVNEKTVNYLTKYVNKQDNDHKEYESKVLTSPGIGLEYISRYDSKANRYVDGETNETYQTRTGHKIAMPIYWRNKIYSEEEREKLWIEKLDKNERWICGERIDVSENEDDYYKTLEHYRRKNKRLGYGDDAVNWIRKQYENAKRMLMIEKRIKMPSATLPGESGSGQLESINDSPEGLVREQTGDSVIEMPRSNEFD